MTTELVDRNEKSICRYCLCISCAFDNPETQTCEITGKEGGSCADCDLAITRCSDYVNKVEADLCLALDVAAEFKRERDEWWFAYLEERAYTGSLEDMLRQMVENCPVCGGDGKVKIWTDGKVADTGCGYCSGAREVLESLFKNKEPEDC